MRSSRWYLTVALSTAALAVTACSSDSDKSEAANKPTEEPSVGHQNASCDAEITLTGAVSAKLQKGQVRIVGQPASAVYESENKDVRLTVYSAEGDTPAGLAVSADGSNFQSPVGDDAGLLVDEKGKHATINSDASSGDQTVHVAGTFACEKPSA